MNTVTPEQVGVSSERLERLNRFMQDYVDDGKFAGIVTMLARKGEVFHFEKFGMMDREAATPIELDTIFRIYSMTKPITSAALMMLYEEGHFQLEDPVSRFIPELDGLKVYAGMDENGMRLEDQKSPITIRQLFTHTAGLSYGFFQDTPVDTMYRDTKLLTKDRSLEEMVTALGEIPLRHQPGTKWRYSVATDVLGRLVEVISGQSFDEYLEQRIFQPLGMIDTGFYVPEEKLDRFPKVYEPSENGSIRPIDRPEVDRFKTPVQLFSGGGGLVSTASDYMRFCQMMLNGGELDGTRLLGRKTVELMTMNHLPDELTPFSVRESMADSQKGCGFGLGFSVVMDVAQYGVPSSVGEHSWGGAASTAFWIDPKEELIAIFMTQFMPSGTYPIRREYHVLAYQALVD